VVDVLKDVKPIPGYLVPDQFLDVLPNYFFSGIVSLEFNPSDLAKATVSNLL
jgi:hypothetical protein